MTRRYRAKSADGRYVTRRTITGPMELAGPQFAYTWDLDDADKEGMQQVLNIQRFGVPVILEEVELIGVDFEKHPVYRPKHQPEPEDLAENELHMKCPKCGNRRRFRVWMEVVKIVTPNGSEDDPMNGDEEWGDDDRCECVVCDHDGKVWQFRKEDEASFVLEPVVPKHGSVVTVESMEAMFGTSKSLGRSEAQQAWRDAEKAKAEAQGGAICQECGKALFKESELQDDCEEAIPLGKGRPGPHSVNVLDILKLEED